MFTQRVSYWEGRRRSSGGKAARRFARVAPLVAGTALKRKMPAGHSVWDRWVMQVTSSNRFRYSEFLQQNLKGHHSLAALWGNRYDELTYQTKKSAENF
jgi:hypothetical protein